MFSNYTKIGLLACFAILSIWSCARLDGNLFNPQTVEEYKLDAYEGERTFNLDSSYYIDADKVLQFTLTSDDDGNTATIYAIYIGDIAEIATDTVIMYCHGNAAHMDAYWPRAQLLANVGHKNKYGVLMIDYRGYGRSESKSTESSLYADVNAALEWLKGNGLTGDRLIMYGFSMGSAPATELTANPNILTPSKLILEAPFASAEVMAQDASKLAIPGSFLTNLKIDNAEEIKKIQQPFLWLHGEEDDFLSIHTHGSVVAKNYKGTAKTEVRVDEAGHSTVPNTMGFEEYMLVLKRFLER